MMIVIGYRVNSKKATEFRKQATQTKAKQLPASEGKLSLHLLPKIGKENN
jgi:hypothetical protein